MFKNVSRDLLEKAQKAKTKEKAVAILREGGFELTEDDLNSISGGTGDADWCWDCPDHCGLWGCTENCSLVYRPDKE